MYINKAMGHFTEKYHFQNTRARMFKVTGEKILTYPYMTLCKKKAS